MLHWRRLMVGEQVFVEDALGREHAAEIVPVPAHWRDLSGSYATSDKGEFPQAWVSIHGHVLPWACDAIRSATD